MILSHDRVGTLMDSPAKIAVLAQLLPGGILRERRMADYAGLSPVYVGRLLREFERFNLARSRRVGRANFWEFNRNSYAYSSLQPLLKKLDEILPPLDALRKMIHGLCPRTVLQTGILYGSVIRGGERDESDIDLGLILQPGISKKEDRVEKVLEQLRLQCYDAFGKRISFYLATAGKWAAKRDTILRRAFAEGEKVF